MTTDGQSSPLILDVQTLLVFGTTWRMTDRTALNLPNEDVWGIQNRSVDFKSSIFQLSMAAVLYKIWCEELIKEKEKHLVQKKQKNLSKTKSCTMQIITRLGLLLIWVPASIWRHVKKLMRKGLGLSISIGMLLSLFFPATSSTILR